MLNKPAILLVNMFGLVFKPLKFLYEPTNYENPSDIERVENLYKKEEHRERLTPNELACSIPEAFLLNDYVCTLDPIALKSLKIISKNGIGIILLSGISKEREMLAVQLTTTKIFISHGPIIRLRNNNESSADMKLNTFFENSSHFQNVYLLDDVYNDAWLVAQALPRKSSKVFLADTAYSQGIGATAGQPLDVLPTIIGDWKDPNNTQRIWDSMLANILMADKDRLN